jgi:hypothetical protein
MKGMILVCTFRMVFASIGLEATAKPPVILTRVIESDKSLLSGAACRSQTWNRCGDCMPRRDMGQARQKVTAKNAEARLDEIVRETNPRLFWD